MRFSPLEAALAAGGAWPVDGGFREWLDGLTGRELVVYGLLVLVVLAGGGLWAVRSGMLQARTAPEPAAPVAVSPRAGPSPAPILVHVAGMVRRPGVYELTEGDRVIDAIEMAGGAKGKAALEALNLAAPLTDGQQVLVPRSGGGGVGGPGVAAPGAPGEQKVNVNTADASTLETLPGIGEVLAQRIVDHREEHGPFTSVDQLIDVSGIGEVTLEELRDLVTV